MRVSLPKNLTFAIRLSKKKNTPTERDDMLKKSASLLVAAVCRAKTALAKDAEGETQLHKAIWQDNQEIINMLHYELLKRSNPKQH